MIGKGLPVSRGKTVSKAMIVKKPPQTDRNKRLEGEASDAIKKVDLAMENIIQEMQEKELRYQNGDETMKLEIVQMQKTMVSDQVFYDKICRVIHQGYSPEAAVYRCVEEQCEMLLAIGDEYLAERVEDFRDVGDRLICGILGIHYPDLSKLSEEVILVGENIPPSLLADGDRDKIKGLVMIQGSKTAHVCILAANMGIPAVVGCQEAAGVKDGEMMFLDAASGEIVFQMSEEMLIDAQENVKEYQKKLSALKPYGNKKAVTKDGTRIMLLANIMDAGVMDQVAESGMDGIGLFRTEFLYMNRKKLPTEMEQYSIYKSVGKRIYPSPVTVRTIDIGGDKEVEALHLSKEENPFLGYRAIRICLDQKEILEEQCRAILRASVHGKFQIMFPMISSMEELDGALAILEKVKKEFTRDGISYDTGILTGMMVEVPSVAIMAREFIKKVDFFSIGSNDLTQYTLAVDRQNEKISHLYDYFHPSVLRLIAGTIRACQEAQKPCSLCGEMAADDLAIPILLGLGLRKFSVNPSSALMVKHLLSMCDLAQMEKLAENALKADSAASVRRMLKEALKEHV